MGFSGVYAAEGLQVSYQPDSGMSITPALS